MTKPYLAAAGVIAAVAAWLAPQVVARQQTATQFEYGRVTHYPQLAQGRLIQNAGYRFCAAGDTGWSCRDFAPADSSAPALNAAWATSLSTLGNEGWELVAIQDDTHAGTAGAFIFKRQRR
jgi:hypothetical protein